MERHLANAQMNSILQHLHRTALQNADALTDGQLLEGSSLAALLSQDAAFALVPPPLVACPVKAAGGLAEAHLAAGIISAKVAALTEGVLKAMLMKKLKGTAAFLMVLGLIFGGGVLVHRCLAEASSPRPLGDVGLTGISRAEAQAEPMGKAGENVRPKEGVGIPVKAAIDRELFTLEGHTLNVSCVTFSPDGKRLASASGDGTVKIWDVAAGKELLTLRGHDKHVWRVAFSPTEDRLASAGADGTVRIWDATSGKELLTFTGHHKFGSSVHSLTFSPDGKRLASGNGAASGPFTIKVWDSSTAKEVFTLEGFSGMISSLAFSPDGRRLASSSGDRKLKIWDALTGKERVAIARPDNFFASVSFSPDSRRLVTANDDRTVTVWDAASGKELLQLKGHSREVTSAVFSPDGKLLASAAFDATVKLWDATTGKELASRKGHSREVHSVAFNRKGTLLASGSADGMVKVWQIKSSLQPPNP